MSKKQCKFSKCNSFASNDGWCKRHRPKHKIEKKSYRIKDNFHPEFKRRQVTERPQEFGARNGKFGIVEKGR